MPTPAKELLTRFLEASEAEVLELFRALPGAQSGPDNSFVYVPGTRPDRLLLVAHADTVRKNASEREAPGAEVFWLETFRGLIATTRWQEIYGGKKEYGRDYALGADDRAGCAMHYDMHDGTHSLLITTGEEAGLVGAKRVVPTLGRDEIVAHSFAVEVDRRGMRQAVFYAVGTTEFERWAVDKLNALDPETVEGDDPLWAKEHGSSSDIAEICEAAGLCGVNLSAGYVEEHTSQERLYVGAWEKTRAVLERLTAEAELPHFALPRRTWKTPFYARESNYEGWWEGGESGGKAETPPVESVKLSNGKVVTLPPEVGKKRGRKLVKLVQMWRDSGQITQDEALQVFQKLVDRSGTPPGDGTGRSTATTMCLHWCNLCEFKAWKHLKSERNCAVQHTHFCPTHSPDGDATRKFETVLYKNVRGSAEYWSSTYPGQDATPCVTCKHTKALHLSHISWCREKGCSCSFFLPQARHALPVVQAVCERCHHTEVVHGENTCMIRACVCSGFVRKV